MPKAVVCGVVPKLLLPPKAAGLAAAPNVLVEDVVCAPKAGAGAVGFDEPNIPVAGFAAPNGEVAGFVALLPNKPEVAEPEGFSCALPPAGVAPNVNG